MPFYEYHCANCGHHHEELQKVTDKPLRKCPACGEKKLHRLVSAPVFRLKGGGWYETDFKSEKEARRNLAGEGEPAEKKTAEAAEKPAGEAAAKPEPAAEKKAPSGKTIVPVRKPPTAKPAGAKAPAAAKKKGSPRGRRARRAECRPKSGR